VDSSPSPPRPCPPHLLPLLLLLGPPRYKYAKPPAQEVIVAWMTLRWGGGCDCVHSVHSGTPEPVLKECVWVHGVREEGEGRQSAENCLNSKAGDLKEDKHCNSCRRSYTAAAAEAKHHLQLLRLALRKGLCIRATGATYTTSTEAKHNDNSCDNIGVSASSTKSSIRRGSRKQQ